jgi:hypothetical protein
MKKVLFIATLISGFAVMTAFKSTETMNSLTTEIALASPYCDGWAEGYCDGWKDVKGKMALCPLTPLCPLAEFGKDKYKDGYIRGFKAGTGAAQK